MIRVDSSKSAVVDTDKEMFPILTAGEFVGYKALLFNERSGVTIVGTITDQSMEIFTHWSPFPVLPKKRTK